MEGAEMEVGGVVEDLIDGAAEDGSNVEERRCDSDNAGEDVDAEQMEQVEQDHEEGLEDDSEEDAGDQRQDLAASSAAGKQTELEIDDEEDNSAGGEKDSDEEEGENHDDLEGEEDRRDQRQGEATSSARVKRKKVTPYFNFCKQNREKAKAQLLAAGQAITGSAVLKMLGELWKNLSDAEKAAFGNYPEPDDLETDRTDDGDGSKDEHLAEGGNLLFPLGRVKKIVRLDKDIKVVSRPALMAITHAAQLFIESLASKAAAEMLKTKRKSLRLSDLEAAVRHNREFLDFLNDSMEIFVAKKDAGSDDEEDEEAPKKAAKKTKELPPGTRCITDFFGNPPNLKQADEVAATTAE